MKKGVLLFLMCLGLLLTGFSCEPESTFDENDFLAVNAYAEEIIPAVGTALFDLEVWNMDKQDEERIGWLKDRKNELIAINNRHFTADFPSFKVMETWSVIAVKGEEEWLVEGEELAPAVKEMKTTSEALVEVIKDIVASEGELSDRQMDHLELVIADVNAAAANMRSLFLLQ